MLWPKSETLKNVAHSVRKWIKIYVKHYKRLVNKRFKRTERYGGNEKKKLRWTCCGGKHRTEYCEGSISHKDEKQYNWNEVQ